MDLMEIKEKDRLSREEYRSPAGPTERWPPDEGVRKKKKKKKMDDRYPVPVDAGLPRAKPVEEGLADELSTERAEASAARTVSVAGAAPPWQM